MTAGQVLAEALLGSAVSAPARSPVLLAAALAREGAGRGARLGRAAADARGSQVENKREWSDATEVWGLLATTAKAD